MPKYEYLDSQFEKRNLVENSRFPQFWNFPNLGRFGWFRVILAGFGLFWFFPGLSKYKNLFLIILKLKECVSMQLKNYLIY